MVNTEYFSRGIYSCKFPAFWVGKLSAKIKIEEEFQIAIRCVCMNGEESQQFGKIGGE